MLTGEPIIVLGVLPSGTTCLATALAKMGVYLGARQDFYAENEDNLGGFFEIKALQELNLRGYSVFGTSFYQGDRLRADWRDVPGSKTFIEEVRAIIRDKFSAQSVWGLKEPAISGLVPLYQEIFERESLKPRYAICISHPLNVSASEIARRQRWGLESADGQIQGLTPPIGEHSLGLWLHYTLAALRDTRGSMRQVFCYDELLADPGKSIRRLATMMLEHPSDAGTNAAIASVQYDESDIRYARGDLDAWPSLLARTYDCCLRMDSDGEGFSNGKFDAEIDELWEEFGLMGKMVRPIQLPSGQMVFSWRQGDKPGVYAQKYSPTGAWQTLRIPVTPPPGSTVQIDPYQMPCQIWIRKAIWRTAQEERRAMLAPGPNGVLEDLFGVKRLTVFGPGPIIAQVPVGTPCQEFELEFQVQSGQTVMNNIVSLLMGGIDQARRGEMNANPSLGRR
jgi:hypothetical protein